MEHDQEADSGEPLTVMAEGRLPIWSALRNLRQGSWPEPVFVRPAAYDRAQHPENCRPEPESKPLDRVSDGLGLPCRDPQFAAYSRTVGGAAPHGLFDTTGRERYSCRIYLIR